MALVSRDEADRIGVQKIEFDEIVRSRLADRMVSEMVGLSDALGESIASAIFEDVDPATAIRRNLSQFQSAALSAVDRWAEEAKDAKGKVETPLSEEDVTKMLMDTATNVLKSKPIRKRGTQTMTGTTYRTNPFEKRADVMAVVDQAARKLRKEQPEKFAGMSEDGAQATARAQVWKNHSELADAYQSLPPENGAGSIGKAHDASTSAQTAGTAGRSSTLVQQGAGVLAVLNEISDKAYELVRTGQFSSLALARAEAWRLNPDLQRRYQEANASTKPAAS